MRFNDLKISTRLGVSFGAMTLFMLVLGVTAFAALAHIADEWGNFSRISLQKREQATRGEIALGNAIHSFKDYLLRAGDYDRKFTRNITDIMAAADAYENSRAVSEREKALLAEVKKGAAD